MTTIANTWVEPDTGAPDPEPRPSVRVRQAHKRRCADPECTRDAFGFPLCWRAEDIQSHLKKLWKGWF